MFRVSSTLRECFALALSLGISVGACGCSHLVESRVIAAFATALESNDVASLEQTTTDEFQQRALRSNTAVTTLKVNLDVPTAGQKVVQVVDEVDRNAKRVQVEVGETGRKVWYRLKQSQPGVWVVDDVFLDKKELANGQSVAARLDLILSLQSFLDVWSTGDEAGLRKHLTPTLSDLLFQLPASERQRMMSRVAGDAVSQENLRPELVLLEETAECRLARTSADLTIKFIKQNGAWQVTDLAVDSRRPGEDISSVQSMSRALLAAVAFQSAYASGDKTELQKVASKRFFEGSLMAADLSIVELPGIEQDKDGPEVSVEGASASYLLQTEKEVVRFGLVRESATDESAGFRVDEVTLYELDGRQNKRLSAAFTAHAVMLLFHEALVKQDLQQLRLNATHDFNTRVWSRLTASQGQRLPFGRVPKQPVEVVSALFQGPVTSITLTSGKQPLRYILRDEQGKVLVDDVQIPTPGQPESFKSTCDLLIPVLKTFDALQASTMNEIRGQASRDFNRMVWNQLASVPDLPVALADHLKTELSEMNATADACVIHFGDERFGTRVELVKEGESFRVNDVVLVSGVEADQRLPLKQILRTRIQNGEFSAPARTALAPEE